ncbi:MAG: lytic transglycosylase [Candidatus Rokuibacteriota bacterium]|nr:MAG: lytic transglycosylase [Candidatus Rokubacteria bacterium]PYO10550.1 MAG: lytic transglycosylase [Candidatus Rokubacteria bacterium]
MDTVGRVTKVQGSDWIIERHLLGLGVLLLTVSAGYFLSGLSGGRNVRPIAQEARAETAQAESTAATRETEAEMTIDEHIKEVADRHGVRADLVAAVIEAESEFNPRAVSRRGARGLMQLMPKTAATLGVDDPFDPKANIEAGVKHLRAMMDRFDNNIPLALAAYNAGEVAVIKHHGIPPYRETRAYVKRILKRLDRSTAAARL